jgi:hypothetical protein
MEATFETRMERRSGPLTRLRTRLWRPALDHRLLAGTDPNRGKLVVERARQLTTTTSRAEVAALLERAINRPDEPRWRPNGAINVQHRAVRLAAEELRAVIELLRGPDPVSPQGVVMANRLLTDGAGPLYYDTGDEQRLAVTARRIADSLKRGPALLH